MRGQSSHRIRSYSNTICTLLARSHTICTVAHYSHSIRTVAHYSHGRAQFALFKPSSHQIRTILAHNTHQIMDHNHTVTNTQTHTSQSTCMHAYKRGPPANLLQRGCPDLTVHFFTATRTPAVSSGFKRFQVRSNTNQEAPRLAKFPVCCTDHAPLARSPLARSPM